MADGGSGATLVSLHRLVYRILSTAMVVSAALLAAGMALDALEPGAGGRLVGAGILALVATPYTTIVAVLAVALKRGDRALLALSAAILSVLLAALAVGLLLNLGR